MSDLPSRLRGAADWDDQPWWWDAPGKTFGPDSPASLLVEAADVVERQEAILRKLVNEPAAEHNGMQWYADLDGGVLDMHLDHLTADELTYLRSLQAPETDR